MNKQRFGILLVLSMVFLAACGGANTANKLEQKEERQKEEANVQTNEQLKNDEEEKNTKIIPQDDSGKVPSDLPFAKNPKFPVGSKVKIIADHIDGLKNAEGTIVGAYDTTAYEVSYVPATGGEKVNNYKWLVSEELDGVSGEPMGSGREILIATDRVEGMKGATAVVESASEGPVYMVDIITTTGEELKNYKWLTESELVASE